MRFRSLLGAAAAVPMMLAGTTGAFALIYDCADYGTAGLNIGALDSGVWQGNPAYIDLVPGDRIWLSLIDWSTPSGPWVTVGVEMSNITPGFNDTLLLPGGGFGGQESTESVTVTEATTRVDISFDADGQVSTGSVLLHCEHSDLPVGSAIEDIQSTIVRESTLRSTELITNIVDASVDAAYAGGSGGSGIDLGPGSAMTVTELGEDSSFWAGVRYGVTFGTADQWTGGQLAGAAGVNWALSDAWVIGAFVGLEKSGFALSALDQTMEGGGYTAGLTGAYRAGDWRLQLTGYASALGYDLDDAGTTASFGALRYVIDGKLTGTVTVSDTLDFVPELGLAAVAENQDAYTDSASVAHAAQQILTARGTAGGKLVLYPAEGGVTVSAGAYADYWTTENQSNSGLTGRVELGGSVDLGANATLSVNGSLDSIGGAQLGASADMGIKAAF